MAAITETKSSFQDALAQPYEGGPDAPAEGATYYDLPALKPGHYGWLINSYFYTGGLASASQFLATVIDLFGDELDRPLVRAGRYIALLGGLISPPLLILDLHTPQRWYNMLRIFRKTSAMSIGSWALTSFGLLSGVAAVGQFVEDRFGLRAGRWLARLGGLPAALAAGVVAIYTGTLLAATNIPLWSGAFPVLSSLFASSAASTAVAALTLATPRAGAQAHRRLAGFGLTAGLAELFFAARVEQHWQKQQVGAPMRAPKLSQAWYLGVFGLGILVPLALHLVQFFGGKKARGAGVLAAVAALIGGFALRAVLIFGGQQSACRPRDYFRQAQPRKVLSRGNLQR